MSRQRLLVCEILNRWPELAREDLEPQQFDETALADLLTVRYGFSLNRAKREVACLLADFDERMRRAVAA
jgi:hypothetical protein